jgi:hypothetical protein
MAKSTPLAALAWLLCLFLATGCATSPESTTKVVPLDTSARTTPSNLTLVSAVFGAGTQFADVTPRVIDLLRQPDTTFAANRRWLQVDPAPDRNKTLVIVYEFRGRRHQFTVGKDGKVSLSLLQRHAKSSRAKSQPTLSAEPLPTREPPSTAPLRQLAISKDAPVGQPYITVTGYCENPGYIVWDEHLRLAEVEAAARFYQPPGVPFVVVQIYRAPQKRWIFEDMRIGRGGRVTEPSRPTPRLLPGDRVVATEMVF